MRACQCSLVSALYYYWLKCFSWPRDWAEFWSIQQMIWSQAEMDGPSHLYLLPWLTTCNQISRTMHSTGSQLPSWRTTCPEHFSHWCKCTAQFKSVLKFNKAYIACLLKKIARIGFLARLPFFLATRFCPRTLPAPASTVQNCSKRSEKECSHAFMDFLVFCTLVSSISSRSSSNGYLKKSNFLQPIRTQNFSWVWETLTLKYQ